MTQSRIPANNFDFLRFALAALVIFSHSYPLTGGDHAGEWLADASGHQLSLGDVAVNFFFVISGYLIAHSYLHSRSVVDFFRKRLLRIYPAFVVAMGVMVFIVLPLASQRGLPADAREWMRVAARTVLLQNYIDWTAFESNPLPHVVNGSTWTIFYEMACYGLTVALATMTLLRRRTALTVIFAIVLLAHGWAWTHEWTSYRAWHNAFSFDPFQMLRFVTYYLAGTVFYVHRDSICLSRWWAMACVVVLILLTPVRGGLAFALPVLGTYALFAVAFSRMIRLHRFAKFGDFSYGIYLYGFPIQQLLVLYLTPGIGVLWLTLAGTALAILAGAASWHLVEKHFLKLKHGRLTSPLPAAEPAPEKESVLPDPAVATTNLPV